MNRRYFLAAAGAAVMTIMAGCDQPESKFAGYWQDAGTNKAAKFPVLLHIRPNGDSFIVTITIWEGPFGRGYEAKEFPATRGTSSDELKVSNTPLAFTYDAATDLLLVAGDKSRIERISKEDYQAALDSGKAEYERRKARKKEAQKAK
ncbi:hypothetical protein [Advenella mimigardefordensis]|uniref:hypothetical protein n=1 Tax=Advenella mimigardefordensis TaxID=302406 RepID=UPI00046D00AA|nr:hypothetical protein [Advenella mimigardefordensis]